MNSDKRKQRRASHMSDSGDDTIDKSDDIPSSVRGAPADMKYAIRKKQNKEAARRSRMKRKEEYDTLNRSMESLEKRANELGDRIKCMENFLSQAGYKGSSSKAQRDRDDASTHTGHSGSGSGSRKRGYGEFRGNSAACSSRDESGGENTADEDVGDEEIDELISKCIGQL